MKDAFNIAQKLPLQGAGGLKAFLDSKVIQYNNPGFIKNDPVSIPHLFSKQQDIEIMGLWASVLAWGQRVTIINKCHELIKLMDGAPLPSGRAVILRHSKHACKGPRAPFECLRVTTTAQLKML
jgi:hypothetical protein